MTMARPLLQADAVGASPAVGDLVLRPADTADMAAVQAIYAHHVLTGTGTFEEVAPTVAEMQVRRDAILERQLPYLVAGRGGLVEGFAYASIFRPRSAYRFTVEDSVYVDPAAVGLGIGRHLLECLVALCTDLGQRRMIAVIGDSANVRSIRLHESVGFRRAGVLPSAGFKFGRWVDAVFMHRPLGEGDSTLPAC